MTFGLFPRERIRRTISHPMLPDPTMRKLLLLLAILLPAACATQPPAPDGVRFIVVRHAEKATDDPRDPSLNEAGQRRAQALAHRLKGTPLQAIYVTEFRRTAQTAAPTAAVHEIAPTGYAAKGDAGEFAAQLRRKHANGNVLIIGHSNTVPGIAAALCACDVPPMDESEYDRITVVDLPAGQAPRLTVLRDGDALP